MALSDRLRQVTKSDHAPRLRVVTSAKRDSYHELKSRVHHLLVETLDLSALDQIESKELRAQVKPVVENIVQRETGSLNAQERKRFTEEVIDELLGLGPLEPLLNDTTISDILVNGCRQVYIERFGKLEVTDVVFKDDRHLRQTIERIVSRVGRRIDEASPMVDARLPDGSRVNAVIPPLAIDGPALSIRRFGTIPMRADELVRRGTLTQDMLDLLQAVVRGRLNILISGGTGAGKTTLLNVLSSFIPETERIVTIEDSAELQLQQPHVVRLETRPVNIEGRGLVTQRDLVRNALRMRPDRIVLGEVRGEEALDMLQAMNTGHDGSLATLHANSPRDALSRLETMIAMAGVDLPDRAVRQQTSSAVDLIVQASRLSDGSRKITRIAEVLDMEGEAITMQDIFVFERRGLSDNGTVLGKAEATGIRPRFAERLAAAGIELPRSVFETRPRNDRVLE